MEQLIVLLLYKEATKITNALMESIAESGCQCSDIRFSTVGTEQTATVVLTGHWDQLTRFKSRFFRLQKLYPITGTLKEVKPISYPPESLPYEAYITMPAQHSLLYQTIQFFLSLPVQVHQFFTHTYKAPLTRTNIIELNLLFIIPPGQSINHYRENILHFCDTNNLEVVLEAKRT